MRKTAIAGLMLCGLVQVVFSANKITMQAVKLNPLEFGEQNHDMYVGVSVANTKACYFKGPNMVDFETGLWSEGHQHWYYELAFIPLSQLQTEFLGNWEFKMIYEDDLESIYTLSVAGPLEDAMFLPVPDLTEPAQDASNVIAEDCTFVWDPNSADVVADDLWLVVAGDGFFYFNHELDISATSFNPGWLEIGDAYCRLGYVDYRPDMISSPTWVSGPVVSWDGYMAGLMSGDKHNFYIKYSLDLNEDDVIDLSDIAVMFSHWLKEK